jgi:hypothetical protein
MRKSYVYNFIVLKKGCGNNFSRKKSHGALWIEGMFGSFAKF